MVTQWIKTYVKKDVVLFGRKLYAVSAYPRFDFLEVLARMTEDGKLEVRSLDKKKLIARTPHIYQPHDLLYEQVDGEWLLAQEQPECFKNYVHFTA